MGLLLCPLFKKKEKSLNSSHESCSLGQLSWDFQAHFFLSNLIEYSKSSKFFLLGKLVSIAISSFFPQGSWFLRITRSKSYPMAFFFSSISFMEEKENLWKMLISDLGLKGGILISHLFLWKYFYCWVMSCNCVELGYI